MIKLDINIINIFLTIAISLITFIFTYNKTIGARKERERTAYKEIVSIMAKLIAHEQINPNLDVILGLIRSKSREYDANLDISYIPSIFEDINTKYIENEFISQDIKKNLIEKVQLIQKEILDVKEAKEATLSVKESTVSLKDKYSIILSTFSSLFALLAAILTIGIISIPGESIFSININEVILYLRESELLFSLIMGILVILTLTLVIYQRMNIEKIEKEIKSTKYGTPILEQMVFSALKNVFPDEKIQESALLSNGRIVDFLLKIDDEKIPIEIKYQALKSPTIGQIISDMETLKAEKAILITNSSVNLQIRKYVEENNIILFDNVKSEAEIIHRLKYIFKNKS